MKQKTKNYLILGFLLFGITLLLFNCTFEDEVSQPKKIDFRNVKTVSFEEAVVHFNSKKIKIKNRQLGYARKGESPLELTPNWQTLKHNEIAYTDAKLTTAITDVNRDGNYESELYFININGIIRNVIFTIFKDKTDEKGNIVNARVFFNDLDGQFLDGYIIENGIFTKRYKLEITKNEQKASFFPFFIFQSTSDNDFSDFGTWCVPDGGELPGFSITVSTSNLTASGPDDGGGSVEGAGHSASYNWYYANGYGSGTYSSYINGATGNTLPAGGGGGTVLTSGQVTSATAAILLAMPIEPDEDGKCPEGYVLNPTTGKCDPICSGGKIYNTSTKNCECPKGLKDDGNGNCIDKSITNCESLKRLVQNDSIGSDILPTVNELRTKLAAKDNEWSINYRSSWVGGNRKNIPDMNGIQKGISRTRSEFYYGTSWVGQIHTHPINTYPIFSWLDLRALMLIYSGTHNDFKNEVFLMVVAPNNITFVIKVDNIEELIKNIENDIKNSKGKNDNEKIDFIMERMERDYRKSTNIKQTFLDLFGKYGISLYESIDANLNDWNKLELNVTDNQKINETPCN